MREAMNPVVQRQALALALPPIKGAKLDYSLADVKLLKTARFGDAIKVEHAD